MEWWTQVLTGQCSSKSWNLLPVLSLHDLQFPKRLSVFTPQLKPQTNLKHWQSFSISMTTNFSYFYLSNYVFLSFLQVFFSFLSSFQVIFRNWIEYLIKTTFDFFLFWWKLGKCLKSPFPLFILLFQGYAFEKGWPPPTFRWHSFRTYYLSVQVFAVDFVCQILWEHVQYLI